MIFTCCECPTKVDVPEVSATTPINNLTVHDMSVQLAEHEWVLSYTNTGMRPLCPECTRKIYGSAKHREALRILRESVS